jgi:penicillin-binding protein 2
MAEKYLTGAIADTWERRYWQKRLREEVRSGSGEPPDATPPAPASDTTASPPQAATRPSDPPLDSVRSEAPTP